MARARLTFAYELDAARLTALFASGSVLEDLQALDGRVALMPSDFSEARAAVVRQLNAAAIPVIAIPLMPYEDGLWASAHPWHVLGSAAAAAWIVRRWRAARR